MDDNFDKKEKLLRAVRPNSIYWENGRLSSAAFKDSAGLSVDRVFDRPLSLAVDVMKENLDGSIVSVKVENCDDVNACVKYLPSPRNAYHSEIHKDEKTKRLAEFQAKGLARCAKIEFSDGKNKE